MNDTSYELYLKDGPTPGTIYLLTEKGLTIGRDPLSDILINDPEVSRQHALLSKTPRGNFRIQDLGSRNGTYVDGKRLGSEPITLQPSNAITMGGAVTLIFRECSIRDQDTVGQEGGKASHKTAEDAAEDDRPNEREVKEHGEPAKQDLGAANRPKLQIQRPHQPVIYSTGEKISKPTQIETGNTRHLSPNLILGLVLLLLCTFASILVFLIYLGGDWFFREIGLVP